MRTSANFLLPMSDAGRKRLRALKAQLDLVPETKERRRLTILDSFDWRLLGTSHVLLRDGRKLELHRCDGDEQVASAELPLAVKTAYAHDFPAGPLREKISKPLSIRAVMPRAEFIREVERFRIMNRDGKVTVRIELETLLHPVKGKQAIAFERVMRVVALKGYDVAAGEVAQRIKDAGLDVQSDTRHYAFVALESAGVAPLDYSSKIAISLDHSLCAREACTHILNQSREQMAVNIPGMLADIDTEFLHDFRVALRRTRSLLQLVDGVYAEEDVAHFKQLLGGVMRGTNRLRDLDVYILEQDAYLALLPPSLRPGLAIFFSDLQKARRAVFRKFHKQFQSPELKKQLKSWELFLSKQNQISSSPCLNAEMPVGDLARKLLRKRFNRIIKDGRKITDSTPDEAVHDLRLQFKKLRYLLEFFRSLFDPNELDFLIKRSRRMQNVLGDFNDVCVQQQTIEDYLKQVNMARKDAVQLCAALGALVAELERKHVDIRKQYKSAFRTLDDVKVLEIAAHLFDIKTTEGSEIPETDKKASKKSTSTKRRANKKLV